MEGGAWNSGVVETGQDFSKARPPSAPAAAPAVEPGTSPAARYNPSAADAAKDAGLFGVWAFTLRCLLVVTTLIALWVMAASKQTVSVVNTDSPNYTSGDYSSYILEGTMKFTDFHAFVALVSLLAIVFCYSVVQLLLCVGLVCTTGTFITSATSGSSMVTFAFDTVLAHALIAAGSAAGGVADYMQIWVDCHVVSKFCSKTKASIVIAFIAFAILATCAVLFPIRLYRMRMMK